ncbi:MAG TPA: STAS domain-containing protein [Luteolibacter sp.]|nr:STAS domain-containing protein [Luteolibacter sp.]
MTADQIIKCGVFEGFSWIRCEGKGSFLNSPLLKSFSEERLAGGERVIVVDLAACSGMDSTFMGTLAGMAARLSAVEGGVLQIADACERNRRSLEDLGLDFLMQINPTDAGWLNRVEEIRPQLKIAQSQGQLSQGQHTKHVLQAHETLAALNEENAREFESVVDTLRQQVAKPPRSGQ